jgi:UDP-N-acetylmuramate dehydrogenase
VREARGVPLAPLTTLRLGGPARRLVVAESEAEVAAAVRAAGDGPLLVLGGGSNLVVADGGFDGTVVAVASRGIHEDGEVLHVQAGEPWDPFVGRAVAAGRAGVEALAGIPGSVGATPIQNVGAYGQEVADTITAVRALDREGDAVVDLPPERCGFAYRDSRFKREAGRWVVLRVSFRLPRGDASLPVRYAELARALGVALGERAPVAAVREAVLRLRRSKGMVVDPGDPDTASAGSFFTNPILDAAAFAPLEAAGAPRFDQPDGRVKTSAAWLIRHAGFDRGHPGPGGRVALSGKHALALTNRGGARTADLLALADEVRSGVRERFGVELEAEPRRAG